MISPETYTTMFGRQATGPLAGVVVADLSRVLAGPYSTMLLADMGALVIKVENPAGDDTRSWTPPVKDGESTYFLSINRGKYSIALDFSNDEDLATVRKIISQADVLVENFKPGGLRRFGLDHETLRGAHPELVYASVTGFGTGGGHDLPGYDLLAQAISGVMDITGSSDGDPTRVGVALVDVITGLHVTAGILAALNARHRTGAGDHIEVNLLSSILSGLVNQTTAYAATGLPPQRMGNEHPSLYPYEPFPTADRDLIIAVGNDGQFRKLCEVIGRPELADDPRFATMGARNASRTELRPIITQQLRDHSADEWFQRLRAQSVPSGPILGIDGGIGFAESIGLDPVALTGKGDRIIPTVRHPITYGATSVDYSQAPPRLNADRDRVIAWLASGAEA